MQIFIDNDEYIVYYDNNFIASFDLDNTDLIDTLLTEFNTELSYDYSDYESN